MDLDKALQAHAEWKLKLRTAIQKKDQLDAMSISSDNACPLGKWLHSEAKAAYSGLASYGACVDKHAAFHREAGKVATAINGAKYAEAEAMLASGTPYGNASNAVGMAVLGLRKEAKL
jgi:methyl-accepting chemotaxis protein